MRWTVGLVAALALAGCSQTELSQADSRAVAEAVGDLSFYCSDEFRDDRPMQYALYAKKAPAQVDRLIRIYRKAPDAIYRASSESKHSIRRVLENTATNLRHCDRRLFQEVEREL